MSLAGHTSIFLILEEKFRISMRPCLACSRYLGHYITLLLVGKTFRDGWLRMGEKLRDRSNNAGDGLPRSLGAWIFQFMPISCVTQRKNKNLYGNVTARNVEKNSKRTNYFGSHLCAFFVRATFWRCFKSITASFTLTVSLCKYH